MRAIITVTYAIRETVFIKYYFCRAARLFTKPTKIAARKDNINALLAPKDFGQETQHGQTQGTGLSLGKMEKEICVNALCTKLTPAFFL